MEKARRIHSALGHQEMQVGMKNYPGSEGLDSRDNSGHQLTPRDSLEITGQRPEGRAGGKVYDPAVSLSGTPLL
jgi:hypothetical protein